MGFASNVFINCPFDEAYRPILHPILFCVLQLGFEPRIATESADSGKSRIDKIVALVGECRFGVHDLSRMSAVAAGELYRLNMPLELGLGIGCRRFGAGQLADKRCLILEKEHFRYQAAISDLAGSDIRSHGDNPERACGEVRSWLVIEAGLRRPVASTTIWGRFNRFVADLYDELAVDGYSPEEFKQLPVPELLPRMRDWIASNPAGRP